MKLLLVNPPNHEHDVYNLSPPLGLMVLAETALQEGWSPAIIDFDLPPSKHICTNSAQFYLSAVRQILDHEPTLVAMTSMGVNSHVALLLARAIKQEAPNVLIALGGPHLASIHRELLQTWPWFDAIVLGEGEASFAVLLQMLQRMELRPGTWPALILRETFASPPRHPFPSYPFVKLDDYFAANSRRLINYEGGRGCVFKCAFCYSPSHYGSVRDLAPAEVVKDWAILADMGAAHVFMVQDNLTNSPTHAAAIANAIADASLPLKWNCYATLPQLTKDVILALGRSNCQSVYLGIDAVNESQKVSFNKRFFRKDEDVVSRILNLLDSGVMPTCAFMADLYSYDEDEFEQVLRTAVMCAAAGAAIRINTFTRYPGTALGGSSAHVARYSEAKVRLMLDCPEVVCENELAKMWPGLFPFHATEVDSEERWVEMLQMTRMARFQLNRHPAYYDAIPTEVGVRPLTSFMRALVESHVELPYDGRSQRAGSTLSGSDLY